MVCFYLICSNKRARSESYVNEQNFSDIDLETKSSIEYPKLLVTSISQNDKNALTSGADAPNASSPLHQTADMLLQPHVPTIRVSKTLTEKTFSSDGSCQFLPGGKEGCTRHNHRKRDLKRTRSENMSDKSQKEKRVSPVQSQPNLDIKSMWGSKQHSAGDVVSGTPSISGHTVKEQHSVVC